MEWILENMVWLMSTMALMLVLYSAYSMYDMYRKQVALKQNMQQSQELGKQISLFVTTAIKLAVLSEPNTDFDLKLKEMYSIRDSVMELLIDHKKEYNLKLIDLLDNSINLANKYNSASINEESDINLTLELNKKITEQMGVIIRAKFTSV